MKPSKKAFIQYLNEDAPSYESEEWIMGGKRREMYASSGRYGECMQKHNPIGFRMAYGEWVLQQMARDYDPMPVEQARKGMIVKKDPRQCKAYEVLGYCRISKKYALQDLDDISRCIYLKKGTPIYDA